MDGMYSIDWWPIAAVGFLVLLDIITGFMKGWATQSISSKKMREGLTHKATYFLMIALFVGIQCLQQHFVFWPEFPTVTYICGYICVVEVISFFENICVINPNIAKWPVIDKIHQHDKEVD